MNACWRRRIKSTASAAAPPTRGKGSRSASNSSRFRLGTCHHCSDDPMKNDNSNRDSMHDSGPGSQEDRQFNVAMLIVGVAMMFVGFLDVFLSISGGFELAGVTPVLLYFAGLALWAQAAITNVTIRYV